MKRREGGNDIEWVSWRLKGKNRKYCNKLNTLKDVSVSAVFDLIIMQCEAILATDWDPQKMKCRLEGALFSLVWVLSCAATMLYCTPQHLNHCKNRMNRDLFVTESTMKEIHWEVNLYLCKSPVCILQSAKLRTHWANLDMIFLTFHPLCGLLLGSETKLEMYP